MSYSRSQEDQRRMVKLYRATRNSMNGGAYYDRKKGRLCRYTWNKGDGRTKFLRRCGNRRVRRADQVLNKLPDHHALHGGEYRRLYAYWWELY